MRQPNDAMDVTEPVMSRPLRRWRRLVMPPIPEAATVDVRERLRRARQTSELLLAFLVFDVLVLPMGLVHPRVWMVIASALLTDGIAIWLNRRGALLAAGVLLVCGIDLAVVLASLFMSGGVLSPFSLPTVDFFAVATLIAATALPSAAIVPVAAINCLLTVAEVLLLPHSPGLALALARQPFVVLGQPLALQLAMVTVAMVWMRTMRHSARRADLAEEVAALRQREGERTRELEEGIRQMLEAQVQVSNGNLQARVPIIPGSVLFSLGAGMNMLISRQASLLRTSQRVQAQQQRLLTALEDRTRGHMPRWPEPTGTRMDQVTQAVRDALDDGGVSGIAPTARMDRLAARPLHLPEPSVPWRSSPGTAARWDRATGDPARGAMSALGLSLAAGVTTSASADTDPEAQLEAWMDSRFAPRPARGDAAGG